jgi:hypothetical protein
METPKALILGAVIVGACMLALLGYIVSRDRAVAKAESERQRQAVTDAIRLESEAIRARLHGLQLEAYERKFGHVERLLLEAFEYDVKAYGTERVCREQSIPLPRCEALEKHRLALYDGDAPFIKPPPAP